MKGNWDKIPFFPRWLLKKMYVYSLGEGYSGDLEEEYFNIRNSEGRWKADLWIWRQLLKSIPSFLQSYLQWSFRMFNNYLKIAFRNIKRHKGYSFINISGLAIGMACTILIVLWIQDELSFDQFHENGDNLYFVATNRLYSGTWDIGSGTPPAFGPALKREYPEVLNTARLRGTYLAVVKYGEKMYVEEIQAGDFSLLQMFTFPLVKGDLALALSNPYSIILTEKMAEKYFDKEEPLGNVLSIENEIDLTVAGVLKNMPHNSMIGFDFLIPIELLEKLYNNPKLTRTWTNLSFQTFAQLRENISPTVVNEKIENRIIEGNGNIEQVKPFLRKYTKIYLFGLTGYEGQIGLILLFFIIAGIILLIACFNYMNLATARSANRTKEVGMRKIVGASIKDVMKQFFSESILMSFISFIFAVVLVLWLLPAFNTLTNKQLTLDISNGMWPIIGGAIGLVILTGIVAGSYPSFFLSTFRPIKILQGTLSAGSKASLFRKILVVMQFTASVVLIICTAVVYKQFKFVLYKDLGFEKEQIVYIPIKGALNQKYNTVKQELLADPGILNITATHNPITNVGWNDHNWNWEGRDPYTDPLITYMFIDGDFIETFDIEMTKGHFFSKKFAFPVSENSNSVVVNEAFMRMMQTDTPVGQLISHEDDNYRIMGVVKDFHFKPLYTHIEPLILFVSPENFRYLYIKIRPDNIHETIERIETVYKKFNPAFPFQYHFLDEDFARLYRDNQRIGTILKYFAFLAIFISCLGLLGLASFMAEQRTKEIGIRRVLGSSEMAIFVLLIKEFIKWVIIANIIACPIAFLAINGYLQNYAYRTNIGLNIFILTGLLSVIIALATVSFQAIKAGHANPVDALKYE